MAPKRQTGAGRYRRQPDGTIMQEEPPTREGAAPDPDTPHGAGRHALVAPRTFIPDAGRETFRSGRGRPDRHLEGGVTPGGDPDTPLKKGVTPGGDPDTWRRGKASRARGTKGAKTRRGAATAAGTDATPDTTTPDTTTPEQE